MKLKPCPFCGSKPILSKLDLFYIQCPNEECGAIVQAISVKAWNTRAKKARKK